MCEALLHANNRCSIFSEQRRAPRWNMMIDNDEMMMIETSKENKTKKRKTFERKRFFVVEFARTKQQQASLSFAFRKLENTKNSITFFHHFGFCEDSAELAIFRDFVVAGGVE